MVLLLKVDLKGGGIFIMNNNQIPPDFLNYDFTMSSLLKKNTLTRYRSCTLQNIENLKKDRLYYSTPANFNDPYDTLLYANYFKILHDVAVNLNMEMDNYLERLSEKDKILASFGIAMWKGKNKSDTLKNFFESIYNAAKDLKDSLRNNVRILCFSEDYLSMLMWSHYADNHKGFAIVYDKDAIISADNFTIDNTVIKKKPLLRPVNYVEQQIDLTEDLENYVRAYRMESLGDVKPPPCHLSVEKLRTSLLEKSQDWSYEREWRVIPRHISLENQSDLSYMRVRPKAVILGSQCEKNNRKEIMDICNKRRISIYKAEINYWEPGFKLAVSELDTDN